VNRETKRLMQRQGQVGPDGEPAAGTRRQPPRAQARTGTQATADRTKPVEFLREVRGELRRVAWPTRSETINASLVVLIALVVLTALIFVMDTAFAHFMLFLFKR